MTQTKQKEEQRPKSSRKWLALPVLAAMLAAGAGAGALSYATASSAASTTIQASVSGGQAGTGKIHSARVKPAAIGTVVSVSGNTITLTGNDSKTYTIDASGAKVLKYPAMTTPPAAPVAGTKPARPTPTAISVSDIRAGDKLLVQGTASGTSVTATSIIDGVLAKGWRGFGGGNGGPGTGGTGFRGGPGVGGTVTAVSGTSVTISQTLKDGTVKTYTVDTGAAKVHKVIDIASSDIKVGDTLNVRGTVSGASVSATDIVDGLMLQKPVPAPAAN